MRAASLGLLALAACTRTPRPVVQPDARPLERTALVVLDKEACPRLEARTFSLEDAGATSGKLWVRKCATQLGRDALDINVDVLGWQWVGDGSSGFSVHEYVYFHAAVTTKVRAAIEVNGDQPFLRVFSPGELDVTVRDIGRVSARAATPAAKLLGVASTIFGASPNSLATSALRSKVKTLIQKNARSGLALALGAAAAPASELDETQVLHPDGALISGSYPAELSALHYEVAGGKTALARAVCVDEAAALVDSVIDPHAEKERPSPVDVVTLKGSGDVMLKAPPCRWVLVTGGLGDDDVIAHFSLAKAAPVRAQPGPARWVRPMLRGYSLEGTQAKSLFQFRIGGHGGKLGGLMPSASATAVWVSANPIELADNEPLVIDVAQLLPKGRNWLSDATTYDERPVGRATLVPERGVELQDRRVPVEAGGRTVGFVELTLESVEVL